jgi:hypothetical protein
MSDEQEWQPARLISAHGFSINIPGKSLARIRELTPQIAEAHGEDFEDLFRYNRTTRNCYTKKLYEIHPDDCERFSLVCEHEILTD